jgi:energy-converting hydrogenase Eha subunit A
VSLRSRVSGERGSATVWVVALAGVLAAIGVAAVLVGPPPPPTSRPSPRPSTPSAATPEPVPRPGRWPEPTAPG